MQFLFDGYQADGGPSHDAQGVERVRNVSFEIRCPAPIGPAKQPMAGRVVLAAVRLEDGVARQPGVIAQHLGKLDLVLQDRLELLGRFGHICLAIP